MKIIYLHQYFKFPNERGGTRSYDLATSFIGQGYDVTVITSTSDEKYKTPSRWHIERRDGLEIHRLFLSYGGHARVNDLPYLKRSIVFFKYLWYSSFHVLKIKADFVIATSTPLTIGVPALVKKWFGKTPFIFEVRDVWPEAVIAIGAIKSKLIQKVLYRLEKLIYKNATAIVPLSTDMQKSIVSRFPQFRYKASIVIENIAEINRFQNNFAKIKIEELIGFKPRFSVLYAGTFGKVNGLHKMVDLAEKTLHYDKELVYIMIGIGAEKDDVIQLSKDKGVFNRNVFIFDPVSKNDLSFWYNSVSMGASFVIDIPELWANSANKFFDSLAAGKPILINHEGWQADAIRKFNIGYVLPLNITEKEAKCFVDYTKNEIKIDQQKQNSIKLAKEKYSLERANEKYLKIFEVFKND